MSQPLPRDLLLDPSSGDLSIQFGDLQLVYDDPDNKNPAGIVSDVRSRLQFFAGEWFLDQSIGLPYYQQILVKNPNLAAVKALFYREILATPGISSITSLTLDFNRAQRQLTVTYSAASDFGPIISQAEALKTP